MHFDTRRGGSGDLFRSTFEFAAAEVGSGRGGAAAMLARLSEMLFLEALRRHAEDLPEEQTGWLAGLRDPHVARALALLHRDVARDWTVDMLGREVGMSRSALAERFTRLIGEPPMRYLARWRLQVAAHALRTTGAPLVDVAERVGYESEAAFNRAFKREFGHPPATWRRRAA
jgi:transcriptional regulator GlxA family with amidase domain